MGESRHKECYESRRTLRALPVTEPKRDEINTELRAPLLVLIVVVPLLAFASWFVHQSGADAAAFSHDIRVAQLARTRTMRYQLDEETGVRGFALTGDALFLQPYTKAHQSMDEAFRNLRAALGRLHIEGLDSIVDREEQINITWHAAVALPAMASRPGANADAVQRRGKQMIDDFRNADQALQSRLDASAERSDQRSRRLIATILVVNLVALGTVVLVSGLLGYLQALAARRAFAANLLYENEKRIANLLQEAFLQKSLPFSPTVGLHGTYVPASLEAQVGGDWYDAFELPDKRILFSIGDVAGHGLEAAIVMSRVRQTILAAALHEKDPAVVLARANQSILFQDARMVTAICGYIDPRTLEIVYATAGHPPPVMARAGGTAEFLPHDGIPLGIMPDAIYRTFVAHALNGEIMVLYTDGVTEHKRDLFMGEARLLEAARLAAATPDPAAAIRAYVFAGSAPADDVAILTISFKDSGRDDGKTVPLLDALHVNRWKSEAARGDGTPPASPESVRQPSEGETTGHDSSRKLRAKCEAAGIISARYEGVALLTRR
jgi:CHASE3 domain sensor protein